MWAVQPQHDAGETVQERLGGGAGGQGLPARAEVPGIGRRVDPMVGKDDGPTVLVAGAHITAIGSPEGRVHLRQPRRQPVAHRRAPGRK